MLLIDNTIYLNKNAVFLVFLINCGQLVPTYKHVQAISYMVFCEPMNMNLTQRQKHIQICGKI